MFIVAYEDPESGVEKILCDKNGNSIIYSTIEEAEKAIDVEIDKFVDELILSIGKS